MNPRVLFASIALVVAAPVRAEAEPPAPRPPAPEDVVTVNDGSVWRGHITEMIAGDHVTIQMASGQQARIRWDAIARVDRAGSAPAAAAAGAPPSSATEPAPAGPNVRLHIDAEVGVRLERVLPRGTRGGRYKTVCYSPCDQEVPAGDTYRISGSGVRGSSPFKIQATQPDELVVLSVDDASTSGFVGGIVLTSLGGIAMLVGGTLLLVGTTGGDVLSSAERRGFTTAGAVTGIGGLAMFLPGVALLSSSSTRVQRAPPPPGQPTFWRPLAPAAFALPIVSGTF
jgi:hypothetical protein